MTGEGKSIVSQDETEQNATKVSAQSTLAPAYTRTSVTK